MRKHFFLVALLIGLATITGRAQDRPGGQDRLVAQFNWNTWLNAPDGIESRWFSRGFNLFFMYDLELGKSPISIAPGIGFATDNLYHNGFFTATDTFTTLSVIPDSITFNNNKLQTTYLEIPLELRFRTKANDKGQSFKIAAGIRGGLLITSHMKYNGEGTVFGLAQQEVKYKQYDVPGLDNLRYGATFRVGYGPVNLSAYYGLSTLFEKGRGPEMVPFQIGLSFNGL